MIIWSHFNILFKSEQYGFFLYNSHSNFLFILNNNIYNYFLELSTTKHLENVCINPGLNKFLFQYKILISNSDNDKYIFQRIYKRNEYCYDNSTLNLTICPTSGCNFRCPYCFENIKNHQNIMDDKIVENLISYIKSFEYSKKININWYGGEPTLAFDVIKKITEKIRTLNIDFNKASIITNGYLLNKKIINSLNSLNIQKVQVTIDGEKEIHDTRRFLKNGKPTYDVIIKNLLNLVNSEYEGTCAIRVNLDKTNIDSFLYTKNKLEQLFNSSRVTVYPGWIESADNLLYKRKILTRQEWMNFSLFLYNQDFNVFPKNNIEHICTANQVNSFVIGAKGELYKCWEDVGRKNMEIGSIMNTPYIKNKNLLTLYHEGTNPYLDKKCIKCDVLPICGGGCPNRRLKNKYYDEKSINFCSLYKTYIKYFLIEYYDTYITNELCKTFLQNNSHNANFRIINISSYLQLSNTDY